MRSEGVREISTSDKRALKLFIALERHFVGSNPLFVSDTDADVTNRLSGRSHFFSDMERALFVASNGRQDVARCAALINRRYQKAKTEAVGFIGYFAAAPDCRLEVESMMAEAEAWLGARGVTRVIAPYNGAAILGMSFLTTGFDEEPMFPSMWHPPYYADYLVNTGYQPNFPLWYYTIDFASDKYRTAKQRAAGESCGVRAPREQKELETRFWRLYGDFSTRASRMNGSFILTAVRRFTSSSIRSSRCSTPA